MALSKVGKNQVDQSAELTVDSDLTVDTNTLYVDSTNNRVGIGTASPASSGLDVTKAGGANYVAQFTNTTAATPYTVMIKEPASPTSGYPLLNVVDNSGTSYLRVDSGTGYVTMPGQPVAYRLNTHTTNGWVTLSANTNNIFSNWYTPATTITQNGSVAITDNGRFTAPTAGIYLVCNFAYVSDGASSGDYGYLYVYKNGTAIGQSMITNYGGSTSDSSYQLTIPVSLSANDYVQIGVYAVGSNYQVYSPGSGMFVCKIA